jgi:hypothetical protein
MKITIFAFTAFLQSSLMAAFSMAETDAKKLRCELEFLSPSQDGSLVPVPGHHAEFEGNIADGLHGEANLRNDLIDVKVVWNQGPGQYPNPISFEIQTAFGRSAFTASLPSSGRALATVPARGRYRSYKVRGVNLNCRTDAS